MEIRRIIPDFNKLTKDKKLLEILEFQATQIKEFRMCFDLQNKNIKLLEELVNRQNIMIEQLQIDAACNKRNVSPTNKLKAIK